MTDPQLGQDSILSGSNRPNNNLGGSRVVSDRPLLSKAVRLSQNDIVTTEKAAIHSGA